VNTAFDLDAVIASSAFIIWTRLVTTLSSVNYLRSSPLRIEIRSTLRI